MERIIGMLKSVFAMLAPSLKNEESKHGIKEFRELLKGVLSVSILMIQRFKDGVQFSDFTEFYSKLTSDEEFKAKMKKAYDGYQQVPNELKDIDAGECLEVACDILDELPAIVEAAKKEEEEKEEESSEEPQEDPASEDPKEESSEEA
jgi:hypothetical protein